MKKVQNIILVTLLASALMSTGCLHQALFDEYIYKETISLKVDALNLMGKSVEDFITWRKDIDGLMAQMQKIYEYEKGRQKNIESIKMWELMLNRDKNLLAGFMKRWEEKGKIGKMMMEESRKQILEAFDIIIALEMHKLKKEKLNSFLSQ